MVARVPVVGSDPRLEEHAQGEVLLEQPDHVLDGDAVGRRPVGVRDGPTAELDDDTAERRVANLADAL